MWKNKSPKRQYISVAVNLFSEAQELKFNVKTSIIGHDTLLVSFQTPLAFWKAELLHGQWLAGQNGILRIESLLAQVGD